MSKQVKNRHDKRTQPAGHDHETDLANRGIRQNLFNVGLRQGNNAGEQRGGGSNYRNKRHCERRKNEQGAQSHEQEWTRVHHGRSMNQGRHRGGGFHSKRQPYMKRHLS